MKRNKKECKKCGRLISLSNVGKHNLACCEKSEYSVKDEWKQNNGKYKCPFCEKEFSKKGISTHIWRVHGNGKTHSSNEGFKDNSRIIWNKGKTKEDNESVKKMAETLFMKYKNGELIPNFKNCKHTEKTKKIISEKLSKNNKGGRCKWYNFKRESGVITKVQGTWEYRFAKVIEKIDENWIKIKKEKKHSYKWIDKDNKEHFYTPDFYSPKLNKYFEVKGYWWGDDENKMKYVKDQYKNIVIDIIRKKELQNFEKLFDVSTTKEELKEFITK